MNKKYLYISFITVIFNTVIAWLLVVLMDRTTFIDTFVVSQSIGLSILVANLFIPSEQYANSPVKIAIYSAIGLTVGLFIGISLHNFLFAKDINLEIPIYSGLFFSTLAIVIVWLYFSKAKTYEDLELIRKKLIGTNDAKQLSWIKASSGKHIHLIKVSDIVYFQAQQKYTAVFTNEKEYLINTPIKVLIKQLNKQDFWQIHRATIINLNFIDRVSKNDLAQLSVRLKNASATELLVSRNYLHLFKKM